MSPAETNATTARGQLGVDAVNAQPPDLDVKVVQRDPAGQAFSCTVSSPRLDGPRVEDWEPPSATGRLVTDYLKAFTEGENPGARLMTLKGAGMNLWRVAPDNFKEAYAELSAKEPGVGTIQVTSDEPHVPWELMDPDDGDPRPLGERHPIARWYAGEWPLRESGAPASNARVAAPRNAAPPEALKTAPAEAQLVCTALAGRQLQTTDAEVLEQQLREWSGTVLHFVCHGTGGSGQALLLDGTEKLQPLQVEAMTGLRGAWAESAPVVFLNACNAAEATPTLQGAGGITQAWITVGAGAVIAPLWSVNDAIAHDVAREFYARIAATPTVPYAEIVREIRALAGPKRHDSYAAYCYFGSPWAAAAQRR